MSPSPILWSVVGLLGLAVVAVPLGRQKYGSGLIYGGSLVASLVGLSISAAALLVPSSESGTLVLPVGLPWLGQHFLGSMRSRHFSFF